MVAHSNASTATISDISLSSETSSDVAKDAGLSHASWDETVGKAEISHVRKPSTLMGQAQDMDSNSNTDCDTAFGSCRSHLGSSTGMCARLGAPPAWHIVWCHELCYKAEAQEPRAMLEDAAKRTGAALVCLKKAMKFATWLMCKQRPMFVLLTDWREVKPCLQAVARDPCGGLPAFTVVVCEEQRDFNRASAWARTLPPHSNPVNVLNSLDAAKAFLLDVAGQMTAATEAAPAAIMGPPAKTLETRGPQGRPTPVAPEDARAGSGQMVPTAPRPWASPPQPPAKDRATARSSAQNTSRLPGVARRHAPCAGPPPPNPGARRGASVALATCPPTTEAWASQDCVAVGTGPGMSAAKWVFATMPAVQSPAGHAVTVPSFGSPMYEQFGMPMFSQHPLLMEQVLRAAMPDRYED